MTGWIAGFQKIFGHSAGISERRSYLHACESVRGWAILLVFMFHWQGGIRGYGPVGEEASLLSSFVYAGNTGVTLFFVLSGFLLTLPFLKQPDYSIREFYINRLLRIMPLYTLVVMGAAAWYGKWMEGFKALVFYDVGLTTLFPFGTVWWSLVIEVQFYLLLPLLFRAYATFSTGWRGVAILLLAAAGYVALANGTLLTDNLALRARLLESFVGRWPNFFFGAVLAWLHANKIGVAQLNSRPMCHGGSDFVFLAVLLALALTLREVVRQGIVQAQLTWHVHNAIEAGLWAAVIYLLLHAPVRLKRLWVNPIFDTLGVLSYSIYLIHAPALAFTYRYLKRQDPTWLDTDSMQFWLVSAAILCGTIALSMLTYSLVERPFLKLKTALVKRRRARSSGTSREMEAV